MKEFEIADGYLQGQNWEQIAAKETAVFCKSLATQ